MNEQTEEPRMCQRCEEGRPPTHRVTLPTINKTILICDECAAAARELRLLVEDGVE